MRALVTGMMPFIRHGLSGAAGYLVAKGHLDPAMTETFVGVGLGTVALVMSYFDPAKKG